ncbi:radical SAM protein [Acidiplasma sp.]|uniref:B12-binding domain-containing radical SAM protein n=1 Tax=Acidiplasma sp. TaxID=1872114 RepID=UPI00258B3279|nr:radical SAM protein [Acidiplasma sp.]
MSQIVLTSDRGTFSNYGGVQVFGYVSCLPHNIVPKALMNAIFSKRPGNPEKIDSFVPYSLRKLEAILLKNNFNDVRIAPPDDIEKFIDENTKVLGINVHDPYGLSPVTFKLTMLFGGQESWNAVYFEELAKKVKTLKAKYNFKVIVGGPAAWQIGLKKPDFVDTVFNGEAEIDFPLIVKKALNGEKLPENITGRMPKVEDIPTIVHPARYGQVQVTRGCPRGCQFCSITPETYRTIPLEDIKKEAKIELNGGAKDIELITDDILLYGQQKLRVNHDAIIELFKTMKSMGARYVLFPHISAPAVLSDPDTVYEMSDISNLKEYGAEAPVVGLETGSVKIMHKYMNAKPFPWRPEDWKSVIVRATKIMNEAYIYPCYTMTIGYPEEDENDLKQSMDIVNSIIDNQFKAFIFPLPVIPMTSSHIHNNPFPYMEKLPSGYWELLYMSWKYDFGVIKDLIPVMARSMNPVLRYLSDRMVDSVFSHLDDIFYKLYITHGKSSQVFSNINLNTVGGFLKSMAWLTKTGLKDRISVNNNGVATKT